MKVAVLCAAVLLAACTPDRIEIVHPPATLLTCAPRPTAPELPEIDGTAETQRIRDELVLAYVLELVEAWADCSGKVAGLRAWDAEL